MKISKNIKYVGVNDKKIDLFEGQYKVPNGLSYNSYVILDEKVAVFDTVDANFTHEWLDNLASALNGRNPDYLIIQHMEPDHSANIANFIKNYPNAKIVANPKAFAMMDNFFGGIDNAKKFILRFLDDKGLHLQDYKTLLQEIIQKNPEERLTYMLVGESGPDHDKRFEVDVMLNSNVIGHGIGKSKKAAEQHAAKEALELMGQ